MKFKDIKVLQYIMIVLLLFKIVLLYLYVKYLQKTTIYMNIIQFETRKQNTLQ